MAGIVKKFFLYSVAILVITTYFSIMNGYVLIVEESLTYGSQLTYYDNQGEGDKLANHSAVYKNNPSDSTEKERHDNNIMINGNNYEQQSNENTHHDDDKEIHAEDTLEDHGNKRLKREDNESSFNYDEKRKNIEQISTETVPIEQGEDIAEESIVQDKEMNFVLNVDENQNETNKIQKSIELNQEITREKSDERCSDEIVPWNNETYVSIISNTCSTNQNVQLVNGIVGEVLPDGQLVVNLINRTDHFLWHGLQRNLCNLLQNMALVDTIPSNDHVLLPKRPLLNLTLDCIRMFYDPNVLGQGNLVTGIYSSRLAAATARVDFQFQCYEGKEDTQLLSLLPWVETYQPAPSHENPWPFKGQLPNAEQSCSPFYHKLRLDFMIDEIMNDMQKMAVTLLGSRDGKMHPDVPADQPPLIPNVNVEDAVIHFRCGDIFGFKKVTTYGVLKYSEYKKWISKDAKSVGIVTQPFIKEGNRVTDTETLENCKKAVYLLVDYLQDYLPSANISIHNEPEDTLPLTYARLAMADQSFASLSTFGIYPVTGGFGKGYFPKGNMFVNPFSERLPGVYPERLFMMNAPIISAAEIKQKGIEEVLKWLVEDENGKDVE